MDVKKFCRTCARYNSRPYKLSEVFQPHNKQSMLDFLQAPEDGLPQTVCINCFELLLTLEKFREKTVRSKKYIEDIMLSQGAPIDNNEPFKFGSKMVILANMELEKRVHTNKKDVNTNSNTLGITPAAVTIKTESKKRKRCTFCIRTIYFNTQEDYIEHLSEVHTDKARPYNCTECAYNFKTSNERLNHISTMHGKESIQCKTCDKIISGGNGQLRAHIKQHHIKGSYKCEKCSKTFGKISLHDFNNHNCEKTDMLHQCEYCPKSFLLLSHYKDHLVTHTEQDELRCKHCDIIARSKFDLRIHLYSRHQEGEAPVSCDHCDQKFPRYYNKRIHMNKFHPEILEKINIKCNICHKRFESEKNLISHMKYPHKPKEKLPKIEIFECEQCPCKFRAQNALVKHSKIHSKAKPVYPCDECSVIFKRPTTLVNHKNRFHSSKLPNKLTKAFVSKALLNGEIKTLEVNEKKFEYPETLLMHESSDNKRKHSCQTCDKSFIRLAQLIGHKRRYHKEDQEVANEVSILLESNVVNIKKEYQTTDQTNLTIKSSVTRKKRQLHTVESDQLDLETSNMENTFTANSKIQNKTNLIMESSVTRKKRQRHKPILLVECTDIKPDPEALNVENIKKEYQPTNQEKTIMKSSGRLKKRQRHKPILFIPKAEINLDTDINLF